MVLYAFGDTSELDPADAAEIDRGVCGAVEQYLSDASSWCIVPPDGSRLQSRAGELTGMLWRRFGGRIKAVIPALGTHHAMSEDEVRAMFPDVPERLFSRHDYRKNVTTLGRMPAEYIEELSEGRLSFDWPVQINSRLASGRYDAIISIGQVVPHEITGMANYTKNILIGTGGKEAIDKSHYLGAVCGMERIMGRTDTPVRRLLNTAAKQFLGSMPILYILTVIEQDGWGKDNLAGIFIGTTEQCFQKAAALSRSLNVHTLGKSLQTCVVNLDPEKYTNFWLGNKAVYRLRMAMAAGGELWMYAPGLERRGEDPAADALIRKYGYIGTERIMELVRRDRELSENLSAAAHLIHGSAEGRFSVIISSEKMGRREIEKVNYNYSPPGDFTGRFPPNKFKPGWNRTAEGEEIFYVPDPALGLWKTDADNSQ